MVLPFKSLDAEATGLDHRRGAFPYAWAACDHKGKPWHCHWSVDPFSRKVNPSKEDVRLIKSMSRECRLVFHNAKFDIRMLSLLGVEIGQIWRNYEDTSLAGHVADASDVPHRLKDLAIKFLDINDDDEEELRQRTIHIRNHAAADLGWTLGEDIAMDYWMPMELFRRHPELAEKGDDKILAKYNILDARRTMLLWIMYEDAIKKAKLEKPYIREKKLQKTVYRMNTNGVTLVKSKLDSERKRYSATAHNHQAICNKIADKLNWEDINIGSGQQLQEILFFLPTKRLRKHLPEQCYGFGLTPTKATSFDDKKQQHRFSTDKFELPKILREAKEVKNHDAVKFLVNVIGYKKHENAVTYLNGYTEKAIATKRHHGHKTDWRLFPDLKQNGTQTTRFSHANPNVANVSKGDKLDPKDEDSLDFTLREVFGPTYGRIWYALDYNQLQLRIFAKVAGAEKLIQAFRDGYDAHTFVATQVFDCTPDKIDKLMRRAAKTINFGFIFGKSMKTVERELQIPGLANQVHAIFPEAQPYMDKVKKFVKKNGFVETLGGYRLPVPKTRVKNGREIDGSYAGVCYIIQGTEGDIVKNAMIDIDEYLRKETNDDAFMTLQVHDELVFDFPRDGNMHENRDSLPKRHRKQLGEIARLMIKAGADLSVETPVACDKIVKDWASGKHQELGEIYVRRYRRTGMHAGQYAERGGGADYSGRTRESRKHRRVHRV